MVFVRPGDGVKVHGRAAAAQMAVQSLGVNFWPTYYSGRMVSLIIVGGVSSSADSSISTLTYWLVALGITEPQFRRPV